MKGLASVCIRRPVFATMLIGALVVAGATSYFHLGVDRYPSLDLPTILVRTNLPGASPEEVEVSVTQPLEEAVNTVEGIEELRSVSGSGSSFVIASFALERDIDAAAQDVRDRIAAVVRRLPRDTLPPIVFKRDDESSPVLSVAVSGPHTIRELTEFADKKVAVLLERSRGVGEVEIVGGSERAINVWLNADRLAAYELPVAAVRDAILRQNADVPGGLVSGPERERILRTLGRYVDAASFGDLVVETRAGAPIRLRDVGRVEDGTVETRTIARLNGVPSVILEVRRQSGANTADVIAGCKAALARARDALPADVRLEVIADQSRYIHAALHEINMHLVLGSILASLVVLAFMRNWRSTLIAAVAIPTSVIATFGAMWALDFTLNGVTMLALVLMVGVVIDDAIVVLENIFRFVEEKGLPPMRAAREATAEIALAVLATTLSLVVIFVPVSFMSSVSGRFLFQFGITAAVAVLVSLLVSFTLTPMMSARLLRVAGDAAPGGVARSRRGLYHLVETAYLAMLGWTMRHRFAVLAACLAVVASAWPLYGLVRQEYLPSDVDEAEFEISIDGPEGTGLAPMNDALVAVEHELAAMPEVRLVLAQAGGGFLGGINQGRVYVRIAPHAERRLSRTRLWDALWSGDPASAFRGNYTQRELMAKIRRRLRKFPELECRVRNQRRLSIGGGRWDVDFALLGPDMTELASVGAELARRATAAGGFVDIETTLQIDKPELRVEIDRARAADLGVDTQDIAATLRTLIGGDPEVSRFRDPTLDEEYDVQLRLEATDRAEPREFGALLIPRRRGPPVRLDNLVSIAPATGPVRIDRLDRQRQNRLRASVARGHGLADRIEWLRREVASMALPATYSTQTGGTARELERTQGEFVLAFVLSVVFMYMILASQFESLVHPLTILASLPIAVPFALLSLWATDNSLNLYSALGILVLFGIVKKNSILQVDHINALLQAGVPRLQAILDGNRNRLRPILMTTLSLVAGMLPLALGTGPGSEERRAIAVVVIGGQTLALLLTLLATPVVYSLFDDLTALLRRRRPAAGEAPVEPAAGPSAP